MYNETQLQELKNYFGTGGSKKSIEITPAIYPKGYIYLHLLDLYGKCR